MKKILTIIMVLLLTSCFPVYDQKDDDNPHYYTDWLDDNGIVDYEKEAVPTSYNLVNAIYKMQGIDYESTSRNIRQYLGTYDATQQPVHVFIPDRVGEPNVIITDLTYDIDTIKSEIETYNSTSPTSTYTAGGTVYFTNDIILNESHIRMYWINYLWGGLVVNEKRIEIDEESLQDFIYTNLSSPMIYKLGTMRTNQVSQYQIYLGQGINDDYVFILHDRENSRLEILHSFPLVND